MEVSVIFSSFFMTLGGVKKVSQKKMDRNETSAVNNFSKFFLLRGLKFFDFNF